MKFGGWHQCSLIDFPGKISAVLFTEGCSFRCPFCHNPGLVLPDLFTKTPLDEGEVLAFLEKRAKKLDGVTISGGEPTLQQDLKDFILKVKSLGLAIKLDTNGNRPDVLQSLLEAKLLDYVAMDIKASLPRYHILAGVPVDISLIERSIHLLIDSPLDYEFRTTIIKGLHDAEDVVAMAKTIRHARKYFLQKFRPEVTLDKRLSHYTAYTDEEMLALCHLAQPFVCECQVRG